MLRPFRFGLVANRAISQSAWIAQARRAEELGYSTLLVSDSAFVSNAPIAALASAAAVTSTLRIGSFVFANDFRPPVLLAKEIATLDQLSGGRFELGIGAGRSSDDYAQLGIPFADAGTRLSRLEEAVHLLKQLFAEEVVHFDGQYYTFHEIQRRFMQRPQPLQKPAPPIYMGGAGRHMLTLAAREADSIGIEPKRTAQGADPDDASIEQKIDWVREAAGERFSQLELSQAAFSLFVHDGPEKILIGGPMHPKVVKSEQAIEILLEQRERFGFSYIQVSSDQMENYAPVVARLTNT